MNPFFKRIGIKHQVSCPHAHQQNGSAERKHRHIVEMGLTLLAHVCVPLKFWDEAFLTAVFLVNRLPSKVINNETPFECLHGQQPDYSFLHTFGCTVWPNLRPYNSRKLQFCSKRCVFLGYSNMHKGFKCLDLAEGRVCISCDVVFDEGVFPFAQLHPNAGARLCVEISLLPNALLSPPTSGLGDAVLRDLSASSPVPANPLMSSTRSPDDVGENEEENNADLGEDRRYFVCPSPGDSRGVRVEVDSVAPADSPSAPNKFSSGSGGNLRAPGAVAVSSSAGADADSRASGSSAPVVELSPSVTGPLMPQPPSHGERSWSLDHLRLVLLMTSLLILPHNDHYTSAARHQQAQGIH